MQSKKIGIDARFYGEAGPGRYVKNIIEGIADLDSTNTYCVFLRTQGFRDFRVPGANFVKVLADHKWYTWDEQIRFLLKVMNYRLDVFYVPHFNVPVLYPFKLVTAIPDMIMHYFSTEKGTTLFKPYFYFKKLVYRLAFRWAVLRSSVVIVPSNDVKHDFVTAFTYERPEKFAVAYEGVDAALKNVPSKEQALEVISKYSVQEPFILYISSFYEHKNVSRLIQAFEKAIKLGYQGNLVLIGKKDKFSDILYKQICEFGLEKRIVMPGRTAYVSDFDANCFRRLADLYVFPSLKEGFSLTPLEAQFVGLACLVSDIPCHREIYADSVEYFDPKNVEQIASKIVKLAQNTEYKSILIRRGHENVQRFSWQDTAKTTWQILTS